jgi:hypothetical protein
MTTIRVTVITLCVAAAFLPGEANAQRRYQPSRPTFSPYLDLFRRDNGLLDSYNAQIVPRRRAMQDFNQLQGTVGQQQDTIGRQQEEINGLNQQLLRYGSAASPTGKGGSFMTHRRYFGAGSGGTGGRRK